MNKNVLSNTSRQDQRTAGNKQKQKYNKNIFLLPTAKFQIVKALFNQENV